MDEQKVVHMINKHIIIGITIDDSDGMFLEQNQMHGDIIRSNDNEGIVIKLYNSELVVSKQYPENGWNIEWIRCDAKEVHFDMKSCIYVETKNKYNCPELCPLFCANDDVTLSGFRPSIIFERTKTIARGKDRCDFHFRNSKYIKSAN